MTLPIPNSTEALCPDGGVCHHDCKSACFRVMTCGPLSGVFEGDTWPADIKAHHQRRAIVDEMKDPTEIQNWPDLRLLPGQLLGVLDLLDAEVRVARARAYPTDHLVAMRAAVADARETLARLQAISPLEAWRMLHPPRYDALDGVYDCGNPACPPTGFKDRADRDLHYERWGKTP